MNSVFNLRHLGCFLTLLGVISEMISAQLRKSKHKTHGAKHSSLSFEDMVRSTLLSSAFASRSAFCFFACCALYGFTLAIFSGAWLLSCRHCDTTSAIASSLASRCMAKAWEVRRVLRTPPSFSQNEVPQVQNTGTTCNLCCLFLGCVFAVAYLPL